MAQTLLAGACFWDSLPPHLAGWGHGAGLGHNAPGDLLPPVSLYLPSGSLSVSQNSCSNCGGRGRCLNTACSLGHFTYRAKQAPSRSWAFWRRDTASGPGFSHTTRSLSELESGSPAALRLSSWWQTATQGSFPREPLVVQLFLSYLSCAKSFWRKLFNVITFLLYLGGHWKKKSPALVCINSHCGQIQWSISNLKSDGYL